MIRDDILPHSANIPKDFVEKIMTILNKGSIHSTTSDSFIGKYTLVDMLTLFVDPDLDPSYLQRLSADDKSPL